MEIQTTFDLNLAVQRWRENLAQSPVLGRENLNELESHLRDSVAALQTRGLSVAEAFQIATHRVGQSHQLEPEFSKVNRNAIWLGRAMWMLIGIQVWPFFDGLMSGIGGNLFALGSRSLPHYPSGISWPVFVSTLIQLPALIVAVWLAWTVMTKTDKFGKWIVTKLPKRSSFVRCCIAACILVFLAFVILIILAMGQWKFAGASGGVTAAFIARSRNILAPLRAIGFAVLTLVLARKLLRFRKIMTDQPSFDLNEAIETFTGSPAFRGRSLNEVESHLRDSVAALQSRGLSAEEGFVIATRYVSQGRQLEHQPDKIDRNTPWLERAMWMLIGVQLWPIFDKLMSGIGGAIFAFGWRNAVHSPSAVGDAWPVFFSALVQLPALIVAVWLTWKVLRDSGKLGRWVATKLPKRYSFVICCITASALAFLLYAVVTFLPWRWYISGESIRITSYIDSSRVFVGALRLIGFAILTLLLARKQFVREKA